MFHIILLNPEIPPNTGNIIRLAANIGAQLHLAGTCGFTMDDALLRRAGLDYHEYAKVQKHDSLSHAYSAAGEGCRYAVSGRGETRFDMPRYGEDDVFVFGCESTGLPSAVLDSFMPQHRVHIPMRPHNRSLNLSNAVAVLLMEAWRQQQFVGAVKT
ncbi:MAG: tRNA (cytidine(34)-2'-O)-methyltransferase [Gammaproteobacteria bacterium WSBS_2016_MAG_OTU1]